MMMMIEMALLYPQCQFSQNVERRSVTEVNLVLVAKLVLEHELVLCRVRVAQLVSLLAVSVVPASEYTYLRQVSPNVCWAELEA